MCVYMCTCVHAIVSVCRSEDNLWQSVLSLHHIDSGDWKQVVRLGGEHLYQLSHLKGCIEFLILVNQF